MPVLSTVEAQLSLHKHYIAKEPQKHGNAKKPAVNYKPAEVRELLQYSVSHKRDTHTYVHVVRTY